MNVLPEITGVDVFQFVIFNTWLSWNNWSVDSTPVCDFQQHLTQLMYETYVAGIVQYGLVKGRLPR